MSKARPLADSRPVRQTPSQEWKDTGYRTQTEKDQQAIVEWLELSIGISNIQVAS